MAIEKLKVAAKAAQATVNNMHLTYGMMGSYLGS